MESSSQQLAATRRAPALRRLDLLSAVPCSLREAAIASLLFVLAAFAIYAPYVARGGFILDDWAYLSEFERADGVLAMAGNLLDADTALLSAGGRPLAAMYFAVTYGIFGHDPALHIAWTVVLSGVLSGLLYALLRMLGLARLHAGAIATLLLVFPASDSIRFWLAASIATVAMSWFLLGCVLALLAFRAQGRRALLLHAGSLGCYVVSLLHYEIAVVGVVLAALLYLVREPWRRVTGRWFADVAVAAASLLYLKTTTTREVATLDQALEHARLIEGQAGTLFTRLAVQDGSPRASLWLAVLVLAAGAVAVVLLPRRDWAYRHLRRWVVVAVGGAFAAGAGYAIFVPAADTFYVPLQPGIGNRTNAAAAIGFVLVYYALAAVVAVGAVRIVARLRNLRAPQAAAAGATLAFALALGALWIADLNEDRRAWQRAYEIDERTLAAMSRASKPPPDSTVFTFGVEGETSLRVPAFSADYDLTGAARVLWDDQTLKGVPSWSVRPGFAGNPPDAGVRCGATAVQPHGWLHDERDASPYGRTLFVHVPSARSELVSTRDACVAALERWRD